MTAPPRGAPGGDRPARSFKTGPRPEYKGKGDGPPRAEGGGYKGKGDGPWKGPPKDGGGYKGKPENFKPKGPPKEGGGYKGKADFKGPPKDGFKKPFKKNKSNAGPKG